MRIAIFSDVHGNLTALQTVLDHISSQPDIDHVVFAGDLCLVGPRPQACIDMVRQQDIICLVGNTDQWILSPPPITDDMDESMRVRRMQLQAICRWTARQLDRDSLDWIDSLNGSFSKAFSPSADPAKGLLIVHANPVDVNQIIFPPVDEQLKLYGKVRQSDDELDPLLSDVHEGYIAFGHIHIPNVRYWKDKVLVNVSSVSLPGDGDSRAKYVLLSWLDTEGWTIENIRLSYAVESEISAFQNSQPPGWEHHLEQLKSQGFIPQIV